MASICLISLSLSYLILIYVYVIRYKYGISVLCMGGQMCSNDSAS